MLCEKCQEREATFHTMMIIGGVSKKAALCREWLSRVLCRVKGFASRGWTPLARGGVSGDSLAESVVAGGGAAMEWPSSEAATQMI